MPNSDLNAHFEDLDLYGEYEELLRIAHPMNDALSKYWEMHALLRLGRPQEALNVALHNSTLILNDELLRSKYLNRLGTIYMSLGNLENAKINYLHSLLIAQQTHDTKAEGVALHNIAYYFQMTGELEDALRYFKSFREVYQNRMSEAEESIYLSNLSDIYSKIGDHELALDYSLKSLEAASRINNQNYISHRLRSVATFLVRLNKQSEASIYLKQLETLVTNSRDNNIIESNYMIAKVRYLFSLNQQPSSLEAANICRKIINNEIVDFDITQSAMIYLIEYLLIELMKKDNSRNFEEIYELIDKLENAAHQNYFLKAEIMLLRSKLCLVEGNIVKGELWISKSVELTQKYSLELLHRKIADHAVKINEKIEAIQKLVNENSQISERFETLGVLEYLASLREFLDN